MIDLFTGSLPPELFPPPANGRADTWAIKEAMAQLMSQVDGLNYWNTLAKFLKGKIDRNEFQSSTTPLLDSEKLIGLHNALILSILYNTTRSELSPNQGKGNPSDSHTTGNGWYKRKRISPPSPALPLVAATAASPNQNSTEMPINHKTKKEEAKDLKRRKLKEAVLALGQRERNRIKEIASNLLINDKTKKPSQSLVENDEPQNLSQPLQRQAEQLKALRGDKYLSHQRIPNVLSTPLASKMKISSSTLYQDYMRCQGALACSESRQLPDFDTLRDRMSLIAYDSGLINGVEKSASSLALIGLEVHLKTLLGDLLSLIRPDRSVSSNATDHSEANHVDPDANPAEASDPSPLALVASTSNLPNSEAAGDFDPSSSNPTKPTPVTLINQSSSNLRLRDLKTQGLAPHLTSRDVAALAEISPHAFVRTHPAALERLIATCSNSSSSPTSSIPKVWSKPVAVEPRFGNGLSSSS